MNDAERDNRRCASLACQQPISGREFVLQVSTCHLRWFCGIDCAVEGQELHYQQLAADLFRNWPNGAEPPPVNAGPYAPIRGQHHQFGPNERRPTHDRPTTSAPT
jgi:hypothetical protein